MCVIPPKDIVDTIKTLGIEPKKSQQVQEENKSIPQNNKIAIALNPKTPA